MESPAPSELSLPHHVPLVFPPPFIPFPLDPLGYTPVYMLPQASPATIQPLCTPPSTSLDFTSISTPPPPLFFPNPYPNAETLFSNNSFDSFTTPIKLTPPSEFSFDSQTPAQTPPVVRTPSPYYETRCEPAPPLAHFKKGQSLLVLDQGDIFVSQNFVAAYQKRNVRKAAELCVVSTGNNAKVGCISASINLQDLQYRIIQGQKFVRLHLLRKVRVDKVNKIDITQGCTKIRCFVRDCIDREEIGFEKRRGKTVVSFVRGKLVEAGIRSGMELAECLDFTREKKSGVHIETTEPGVNYRLTFKFDFFEELQCYQHSQVYVSIQSNSSKGVLIEFWDWYLWKLDMHLNCLIKSSPKSFVFGLVLSSVKLLSDDDFMYDLISILAQFHCRISHYVKGGKLKADSANKLTLLVQMPQNETFEEQKITASEVMKEICQSMDPITDSTALRCATAEIAEVVTLTQMACSLWTALMMCGVSQGQLWAELRQQMNAEEPSTGRATMDFLTKIVQRTSPIFTGYDIEYARMCARIAEEELTNAWICDLVNQAHKSECDRKELNDGIAFLGSCIEAKIATGHSNEVQFLRDFLLGGKCKADLEQDKSIYNPGKSKSWMQCFKWKFNKEAKEKNQKALKRTLKLTWGRSQIEKTKPEIIIPMENRSTIAPLHASTTYRTNVATYAYEAKEEQSPEAWHAAESALGVSKRNSPLAKRRSPMVDRRTNSYGCENIRPSRL